MMLSTVDKIPLDIVFVSYAKEDKEIAKFLINSIEQHGLPCWHMGLINIGDNYRDMIDEKLSSCIAGIVIWSKNSVGKDTVTEEAEHLRNNRKLLPIAIDNCRIPYPFNAKQTKRVELDGNRISSEIIKEIVNKIQTDSSLDLEIKNPYIDLAKWTNFYSSKFLYLLSGIVLGAIATYITMEKIDTYREESSYRILKEKISKWMEDRATKIDSADEFPSASKLIVEIKKSLNNDVDTTLDFILSQLDDYYQREGDSYSKLCVYFESRLKDKMPPKLGLPSNNDKTEFVGDIDRNSNNLEEARSYFTCL